MTNNESHALDDLPHTRVIGPSIYYHRRIGGKIVQRKLGRLTDDVGDLKAKYIDATRNNGICLSPGEAMEMAAFIKDRWRTTKINAKRREIDSDLSEDDFLEIFRRSGGRCEITGIPFSLEKPNGARRAPYAPSLDRIDSKGPYSVSNCRAVLCLLNLAMNEWGLDALAYIVGRLPASKKRVPYAKRVRSKKIVSWGDTIDAISTATRVSPPSWHRTPQVPAESPASTPTGRRS